jgi:proline dehydrogenase
MLSQVARRSARLSTSLSRLATSQHARLLASIPHDPTIVYRLDYRNPPALTTRHLASASPLSLDDHESAPQHSSTPQKSVVNPVPNFDDAQLAYSSKSTADLLRAATSFGLCQVTPLVRHAEGALSLSRKVLGDRTTDGLLKYTLFGHFCAGEDETKIQPAIRALEQAGIGSILDYAAEDDGSQAAHGDKNKSKLNQHGTANYTTNNANKIPQQQDASGSLLTTTGIINKARVYDYESEDMCDRHVSVFQKCIQDVASLKSDGFAAIKVTALGNPKLLERMSRAIIESKNLFAKFDVNKDGVITRDEFVQGYNVFFKDDTNRLNDLLEQLVDSTGQVDYISWSMLLTPA